MPNFDRLRTEAVYNTRAVVQKTGVPADTFRAWERRYGLPTPCRTPGNQRLYSERDIATIGWLRDQTIDGVTISQAVALFDPKNAWKETWIRKLNHPSSRCFDRWASLHGRQVFPPR